jgi:hypothetical protein
LIIAVVVALPSLGSGFFADDLMHVAIIEGSPAPGKPWDLFTFATGNPKEIAPFVERGPYPWWTNPELKLRFFRPVSTLLIQIDHALFGRWAPGYHLHSLLWYLLGVFVVSLLFRAVLPVAIAAIALLLFAVDGNHFIAAAWPANRNAMVAFVSAMLAVWAYVRFRQAQTSRAGYTIVALGIGAGGARVPRRLRADRCGARPILGAASDPGSAALPRRRLRPLLQDARLRRVGQRDLHRPDAVAGGLPRRGAGSVLRVGERDAAPRPGGFLAGDPGHAAVAGRFRCARDCRRGLGGVEDVE